MYDLIIRNGRLVDEAPVRVHANGTTTDHADVATGWEVSFERATTDFIDAISVEVPRDGNVPGIAEEERDVGDALRTEGCAEAASKAALPIIRVTRLE